MLPNPPISSLLSLPQLVPNIEKYELNRKKIGASKYDFVKVKVWLENHYYVFSRFIVCRMLTVCRVKYKDAVNIALDLKKKLVDKKRFDVTQQQLEEELFELLKEKGYSEDTFRIFRMITRFHHERVPLLLLFFGTGCACKSNCAAKLAESVNVPNVLTSDIVFDLLNLVRIGKQEKAQHTQTTNSDDAANLEKEAQEQINDEDDNDLLENDEMSRPCWLNRFNIESSKYINSGTEVENLSDSVKQVIRKEREDFLAAFKKQSLVLREALQGDVIKCLNEGKSIIIEGNHLDPSLFSLLIQQFNIDGKKSDEKSAGSESESEEGAFSNEEYEAWMQEQLKTQKDYIKEYEKKGIIIPFFLKIKTKEHLLLLEEQWLANTTGNTSSTSTQYLGDTIPEKLQSLNFNFETLQDYLEQKVKETNKFLPKDKRIAVVNVSLQKIEKTISQLHEIVLNRIEAAFNKETGEFKE